MGINLMDMVKDAVGDQLANQASGFLGESAENTTNAIGAALPAILGGLMKKGTDAEGAQGILDFMKNANVDGSILDNLGGLFGGGERTNGLLNAGGGILDFVFGNNSSILGSIFDLIGNRSGMSRNSSSSLMKMVAPLLMGVVGRYVKNKALDAIGLSSLLGSQKEHVQKAAPAGLFDKLGLGALGAVANAVTGAGEKVADTGKAAVSAGADTVKAGAAAGSNLFSKILPWLILAAAALGLLWFMKGCDGKMGDAAGSVLDKTEQMADKAGDMAGQAADAVGDAAGAAVDAAGAAVDAAGDAAGAAVDAAGNAVDAVSDAISSISLPGGAQIEAAAGSFTDRIAKFLGSDSGDANTRFTFDGVNFATGSANLTEESMTQLQNLASIMSAYGSTKIRVEGHTDNTGAADANQNLSEQRALAVKRALNGLGVANDRIEAVGKGQDEPIASNDTEEGRLQNRRVDVFVTSR